MKIYTQDHRWYGVIIVTATSIDEAREKMESGGYDNYDSKVEIQEHELENFEYVNYGDM